MYKYGLQKTAVEIVGMQMATDMPSTFGEKSMMKMVGYDMTKKATADAFRQAGMTPNDVQVSLFLFVCVSVSFHVSINISLFHCLSIPHPPRLLYFSSPFLVSCSSSFIRTLIFAL